MAALHHRLGGGQQQRDGGVFCTAPDSKFCDAYSYFSYSAFFVPISLIFGLLINVHIVIAQ
jgi:hypothetical protein